MLKQDLLDEFLDRQPALVALGASLQARVEAMLAAGGVSVLGVSHRIKSPESLGRKLARPDRIYRRLDDLTDLVGVRIITFFEDSIEQVALTAIWHAPPTLCCQYQPPCPRPRAAQACAWQPQGDSVTLHRDVPRRQRSRAGCPVLTPACRAVVHNRHRMHRRTWKRFRLSAARSWAWPARCSRCATPCSGALAAASV